MGFNSAFKGLIIASLYSSGDDRSRTDGFYAALRCCEVFGVASVEIPPPPSLGTHNFATCGWTLMLPVLFPCRQNIQKTWGYKVKPSPAAVHSAGRQNTNSAHS
jgi:hypothetical protein